MSPSSASSPWSLRSVSIAAPRSRKGCSATTTERLWVSPSSSKRTVSSSTASAWRSYDLGQTFAGHPVTCAAGLAAIDEYADGLVDHGVTVGDHLEERLRVVDAIDEAVAAVFD